MIKWSGIKTTKCYWKSKIENVQLKLCPILLCVDNFDWAIFYEILVIQYCMNFCIKWRKKNVLKTLIVFSLWCIYNVRFICIYKYKIVCTKQRLSRFLIQVFEHFDGRKNAHSVKCIEHDKYRVKLCFNYETSASLTTISSYIYQLC